MPVVQETTHRTLRAVMRPTPTLAPEDSVERFIQTIRFLPVTELPVTRHGYLCGIVTQADLLHILTLPEGAVRDRALHQPIEKLIRPAQAVATPEMSLTEIGSQLALHHLSLIPVVDSSRYCLGVVVANDLLAPALAPSYPAPVGGMATPFGVYLTNGSVRAGVGDGALVAAGALIGGLHLLSRLIVDRTLWFAHRYADLPEWPLFNPDVIPTTRQPWLGLISLGWYLAMLLLFLLLIRVTRIASFHAAEHQTVHAMERNETLLPEIVGRMPRAHPRCGTNLLAAGLVFFSILEICNYIPGLDVVGPLIALLMTLFSWRRVGTILQERFTTKPAGDREIASGIAAATALTERYFQTPPSRPRLYRRLWCMGLIQTAAGVALIYTLYYLIAPLLHPWLGELPSL